MSQSPFDSGSPDRSPQRRSRPLVLGALALVVIAAAGFAYLRSNNTPTTGGVPATNPLAVGLNPARYAFVTPSLGWAVINPFTPSSSVGQFRVFRTVDGAKHWELQLTGQSSYPPGLTPPPPPQTLPITVHFFDTTHGYMAVGLGFTEQVLRIYLTSDGGDAWQAVQLPDPQSVVVSFSDATHAWALAANLSPPGQPPGQRSKLYATSDGGGTWERLPDPPRDAYDLAFRGPSEAWMGSGGPGPPHVYTSTDAGHSWQRHDLPPPPGRTWDTTGPGTTVQLLPQIGAVATTETGAYPSTVADLFTSFDTGSTWRFLPALPGEVGYEDAFHWWAIKGTVLSKSADAGQTWSQVNNALPDWQLVPHVLDSKHAWAELAVVGGYGLALTNDGGLHWTRGNVPQLQ